MKNAKALKQLRNTTELLFCTFGSAYRTNDYPANEQNTHVPSLREIEYVKSLVADWEKAALKLGAGETR